MYHIRKYEANQSIVIKETLLNGQIREILLKLGQSTFRLVHQADVEQGRSQFIPNLSISMTNPFTINVVVQGRLQNPSV